MMGRFLKLHILIPRSVTHVGGKFFSRGDIGKLTQSEELPIRFPEWVACAAGTGPVRVIVL
jgi:hypothetical protein